MAYREVIPHAALRPFIDRFWLRTPGPAPGPAHILPDGCIDVLLAPEGATVVGTMTRARAVTPGGTLAGVRFRPGGAVPFLRIAAIQAAAGSIFPIRSLLGGA